MKKISILIFTLFIALSGFAQNTSDTLAVKIRQNSGWVWLAPQTPQIEVVLNNPKKKKANAKVALDVKTDKRAPLFNFNKNVVVAKKDSAVVKFPLSVAPGFYRCTLTVDGKIIRNFNIGYEPEKVISPTDAQPDLKEFWDAAKAELATVAPEYRIVPCKDSVDVRAVYRVYMKSLEGVEVEGYYCRPVKDGVYPVLVHYNGYGAEPWCPDWKTDGEKIDFFLSVRGQCLNKPRNTYGDWIVYNLGDKNKYYYRGAFMDAVRAIDFVCSRPEVDTVNIFVEGGSQGGALTLAVAALDKRVAAIMPWVPFLSDYPDYFQIVHWPAEPILKKQKELGISDKDLYTMLSYFDIKNLAPWITCPVMMASGLQDETCPPHTNFSGYNNITAPKEYHIFTNKGHDVEPEWFTMQSEFMKKHMGKLYIIQGQ